MIGIIKKNPFLIGLTALWNMALCLALIISLAGCTGEEKAEEGAQGGTSAEGDSSVLKKYPNSWVLELIGHDNVTVYSSKKIYFQGLKGKATAGQGAAGKVFVKWETYVSGVLQFSGDGGWTKLDRNGDSFYGEWMIPSVTMANTATNKIRVTISDQIGNSIYDTVTVTVDATKPQIAVSSPVGLSSQSTYYTNSDSITVGGSMSDNVAVTGATWANSANASSGALAPFVGFSQAIGLASGENIITLQASDAATNSHSASFLVYYDPTPPVVAFSSPTTSTSYYTGSLAPFALSGTMSDAQSGMVSASWLNTANGSGGSVALGANFTIPNIPVVQGINPITITVNDRAGNVTNHTLSYIASTSSPVITAGSFSINGGATIATNKAVTFNIQASDSVIPITRVCLRNNTTSVPGLINACWISVTPAHNLNVVGQAHTLGSLSHVYNVYAWVQNQVGSISSLSNSGAGTAGRDRVTIEYRPSGTPPALSGIVVANTDIPTEPSVSQLSTATTPIFIKWRASDVEGMPGSPIKISYTTDYKLYADIATNLVNGANGTCTPDHASSTIDDGYTGCYRWTSGVPNSATKFAVRVEVTDNTGFQAGATGPMMNASNVQMFAGNFDSGIGLHGIALSTMTRNTDHKVANMYHDAGTFVVASNGDIYLLDSYKGLIKVDMASGVSSIYVHFDSTATAGSGDGGNILAAKLKAPIKLAIDHSDNLYVMDFDRIRKINTSTGVIERFIGGGTNTGATIANKFDLKIGPFDMTTSNFNYTMQYLMVQPNGNMIFTDSLNQFNLTPNGGYYLRQYDAASGAISKIIPSGIGAHSNATIDVATCRTWQSGFTYDLASGNLTDAFFKTYSTSGFPACGLNMYRAQVGTWVSTGPHIDGSGSFLVYGKLITGMDGKIYMMDRMYASLYSWNTTTGVWTKLAGNNNIRGECDDGTVGTSCGMDIIDAFITRSGVVYIRELNRIRRLDSTNSMRTVLGRPAKSFFGHSAMATKLGSPNTFTTWKNGSRWEYSWIDGRNYYLLNLKPIGNTTHLAGNGMSEVITGGGDARTKGFLVFPGGTTYKTMMAQNTTNGDIYYNYRSDQIGRLTQAGMSWSTVVGGGGTAIQGASDGLVGLSVAYSSAYLLVPIGFHGSNLLVSYTYLNGSYRTMMKLYNGADSFRQSHFAGVDINNTTNQCSNGTAIGSCIVGWAYSNGGATYNTYDNTWFTTTSHASGGNTAVQIFPPAGTKNTVNLTRYPMGAARKHDASNNFVYYCEFVTGKIYKRNVGAATEAEIVPALNGTVSCVSNNLYYNSERNTLAVAVEYLGGYGLIEIPNP